MRHFSVKERREHVLSAYGDSENALQRFTNCCKPTANA